MNEEITVALVEDQAEFRRVIEMALSDIDDLRLLGVYGTSEKLLQKLSEKKAWVPDVILLDLNLFGMGGLEALPLIKRAAPRAEVIVLTNSNREEDVLAAIANGASGYLLKSATVDELAEGIRMVRQGAAALDPKMARYLLDKVNDHSDGKRKEELKLSKRKIEVLELIAEGLVKKEIAERLDIAYGTVETYVKMIYQELGVSNAPSAVSKAYQKGLLKGDENEGER
jgi:DNA-binding NarL/FixJ family response regulator